MHEPTEDKSDDMKDSFYEQLEHVFDRFLKYHRNFCWEISMQNWEKKIFSNQQLWMSLQEINNDNGVK
jgi:hypothetical protein